MIETEPPQLDAILARLGRERARRDALREEYRVVADSRFHALRMLWLSFKSALGMRSAHDRYAAWSPGLAVSLPSFASTRAPEKMEDAHRALISSWKRRTNERPLSADPLVSVVIPVYNHLKTTVRCLQSLADTWFEELAVQIILVDDGSSDASSQLASRLPGLDLVRNGNNAGFIRACNRGASIARGRYICFLNNDTIVRNAWLDHLVTLAENDAGIGVVGAKLAYPDGRLQEAGGIIFRDGNGWNYGRGDNPSDPRYNYVRDVDYCSGAALLVRSDLFREVGGFSETYVPAYYEDADLCFAARERGYRVVYQPLSEVVHDEGVSSGTNVDEGTKAHQARNRPIFRERWAQALERHYEADPRNVPAAARRLRTGQVVLVVDSYVPMHDREAGSNRLMRAVRIMRERGYSVIFLPDNYAPLQPYTAELQMLGVEVLHHIHEGRSLEAALDAVLPFVDVAWICRPDLFEKYEPLIRRNERTACIYDTIDLHFVRKRREIELLGGDPAEWRALEAMELALSRRADAVVVVTEEERATLASAGIENIEVIPTLHEIEDDRPRSYEESEGLLFIANYNHPPNIDAARWLCDEVMPRVRLRLPRTTLTLLGNNPGAELLERQSAFVRITGYVPDPAPYFRRARIFVGALRYGAGHKGKIGQAFSYGLPVVMTTIAAEGYPAEHERDCLIADDADAFAEAIVRLHEDPELWEKLSRQGLATLAPFSSSAVSARLHALLQRVSLRDPVKA